MPINFIAVQCFNCSTMQVKQEKKSSNKWNCVVCGEKQSLRQVFSQGFMAKDVRNFVQKFNMSRIQFEEEETFSESLPNREMDNERKRRTDWTEYVDDETDECLGKLDVKNEDSELESLVVTEIPKELLLKRPKLKHNSVSGSQLDGFQKTGSKGGSIRNGQTMNKRGVASDEEEVQSHNADRAFKWNALRAKIHKGENDSCVNRESWTCPPTKVAGGLVSKWDAYSTGDENEAPSRLLHRATAAKGPVSKWSSFVTEDDNDDVQFDKFQRTGGSVRSGWTMNQQDACSGEEHVEPTNADRAFNWNVLRAKIHKVDDGCTVNSEPLASQPTKVAAGSVSKWAAYSTRDDEPPSKSLHQVIKGPSSKWSSFVTEDDYEEAQIRERGGSSNCASYMNSEALESLVNDEKVEDDVHPDFL